MSVTCPSCDRSLTAGAKNCVCGWTSDPKTDKESPLLRSSLDHQCSFNDHGDRCRYPVNFFEPGQTRSFCRYHKKHLGDMEMCRKILARSWRDTDADYQARSNLETYGPPGSRSIGEEAVFQTLYTTREANRVEERAAA